MNNKGSCAFRSCPLPVPLKQAKARWRDTKKVLNREAKTAFRKGSYWTKTRGGFPAIVSKDKKYAVAFKRGQGGNVVGVDVGAFG